MGRRPLVQRAPAEDERESPGNAWRVPHLGEGTTVYVVGAGDRYSVWAVVTYPGMQALMDELGLRRTHSVKLGREFLRKPTSEHLGRLLPPDHDPPGH